MILSIGDGNNDFWNMKHTTYEGYIIHVVHNNFSSDEKKQNRGKNDLCMTTRSKLTGDIYWPNTCLGDIECLKT